MTEKKERPQLDLFEEKQYQYLYVRGRSLILLTKILREKALYEYFKKYSKQKLTGNKRKDERKIARWLDKHKVWISDTTNFDFKVGRPNIKTVLACSGFYNKEKQRIEYLFEYEEGVNFDPNAR